MPPTLAYFVCLLVIAPAAALALAFWGVSQVANCAGWRGLGRLFMQLLELFGSPPKLIAIVLVFLAVIVAGCFRSSQPAGFLVLGLLGVISIIQILSLDRSLNAWVLMTLPSLAVVASFWWAWTMLAAGLASSEVKPVL